ncbi:isochorismate synthase MenF [Halobaculum sp. MBLA0143]|uniref:isochorismate synthase n=1 Tax=Halobaculum sp. MBLA0143 TaxID=3079933 RepID=UPI00352344D3
MNTPEGESAEESSQVGRLVSRSRPVADVSFPAFLADNEPPRVHWASPTGLELAGSGATATLTATGSNRFDDLRAAARRLFDEFDHEGPAVTRPRAVGGLSFDGDHEPVPPWEGFPAARFVLPAVQLTRGDDTTHLTATACGPDASATTVERRLDEAERRLSTLPMMQSSGGPPGVAARRWLTDRENWVRQVRDATDRIADGDLLKVVLATALSLELDDRVSVPAVLERLRRTYPDCYRFLVQPADGGAFFGPPPERLVERHGRRVRTEALAGSMPRGETPEEDADHARALLDSEKIRHEQGLVADTIHDQLSAYGDVTVGDRGVRKLTNIQHLQTPITATLDGDTHVLELVEALHPTPAVGGLPLARALATIRETETFDRGWYASPVGWFDADGDGEFAVGIRSGLADGTAATLFAGNGIVADSDPDDEWAELQPKVRPILDELVDDGGE